MRLPIALAMFSAAALTACHHNPDTPGGRAADARHDHFEAIGDAMKTIDDEFKTGNPNLEAIRPAAGKIARLASQLPSWFPTGSGPQDGMHTDAREAVWTRPGEFKTAAAKFAEQADLFNTLAQGDDVAALGQAMNGLGGACKACHDKFREAD